jgi:hypothetical protein
VRHTTKVDNTLDRVIQANTALDLSVSDLKQSMELVATRLATVEKARTTLSTPGTVELDPVSLWTSGRRSSHQHQGVGTAEVQPSSHTLVRGEHAITTTDHFTLSDEDDEFEHTEYDNFTTHRPQSGPKFPRSDFPISTVTTRNGTRKIVKNISSYMESSNVCGLILPLCSSKGMQHYGCRPMRHYIALLHGQSCV